MLFNPYIVSSFSSKDLGTENIYIGIDLIEDGKFMGSETTCDIAQNST